MMQIIERVKEHQIEWQPNGQGSPEGIRVPSSIIPPFCCGLDSEIDSPLHFILQIFTEVLLYTKHCSTAEAVDVNRKDKSPLPS